jgi:hypothetical protein
MSLLSQMQRQTGYYDVRGIGPCPHVQEISRFLWNPKVYKLRKPISQMAALGLKLIPHFNNIILSHLDLLS